MREISFGPVVNKDGTPTAFTKQMFQIGEEAEVAERLNNRMNELRESIVNDFSNPAWRDRQDFRGAVLEAARQCVVEMQGILRLLTQIETKQYERALADASCNLDCGCLGNQFKHLCNQIPSCDKCFDNGL